MPGLGILYDIGSQWMPVADLAAGAQTGHRIHLSGYESVTFVIFMSPVNAGTDTFVPDVQQHTAASGGTSADLDASGVTGSTGVTTWHHKTAASLAGTETWATITQAAASEVSLTGATYSPLGGFFVIEVEASQLAPGYAWVSIIMADPGTGGTRAGAALAILNRPQIQRAPANLQQLNV